MNARRSLAAFLLTLSLAGRAAAAEVSDVDRATARALTLEGYEALDRKDFATAADRFGRADALYHVPTVALGLAHAEVGLGKLVSALGTYSRIVREGAPPGSPPAFTKAVEDARREIDALTQRIPGVIVEVRGSGDARVTIDGVEVPSAALGVKRPVDPGAHVVRASAAGFTTREVNVAILEGKVETVTLDLQPEALAPAVIAPPPAPIAKAPPPPAPSALPPSPPAPREEASAGSTQRTLGFIALGVGGAGLGLGAITGGLALAKHSSLTSACPEGHCASSQQTALQSDVDSFHTLGTISTAGFITAGVGIGAGAILLLTAPRPKAAGEASITPIIGLGYAGARGTF